MVLANFARDLAQRGWRVGGIVIETVWKGPPFALGSVKTGLDLLDVVTGDRLPLARPTTEGLPIDRWVLDTNVLDAARTRIRAAVRARVDLMIIDKFGPLESRGEGFAPVIADTIRAGVPLMTAVRGEFLESWDAFARPIAIDPAVPLRPDSDDLWRWWGPERITEELIRGVPDDPAETVVIGFNWVLVAGPRAIGLAHAPARGIPGCAPIEDHGPLTGRPLSELAAWASAQDPMLRALGHAAINAHINGPHVLSEFGTQMASIDGLAALGTRDGRDTVVVGRFPNLDKILPKAKVVETVPAKGEYPAWMGPMLAAQASRVAITASAVANGSAPALIRAAWGARTALIGPSTPLHPGLHSYGIDILSGFLVEDRQSAINAVQQGGHVTALKRCGRKWSLVRNA